MLRDGRVASPEPPDSCGDDDRRPEREGRTERNQPATRPGCEADGDVENGCQKECRWHQCRRKHPNTAAEEQRELDVTEAEASRTR